MNRWVIIGLMLGFLAISGTGWTAQEFRGVWLRPPDDPAEIPVMLDQIAEAGFNAVLVETFYHGFTISATSPIPTRPQFEGLDILQMFIDEGHKRNLEIHAWVEVFYWEVDTEKYPQFPRSPLLVENPEWISLLRGGRETWEAEDAHRFANPAHPEVRTLLLDYFQDLLERYPLDGLNLDYIRYTTGEDAGYDDFTIEKFKAEKGWDPSTITPNQTAQWKEWVEWRENQVTEFVQMVRDMQQKTKPEAHLSAAIFSGYYQSRYQDHFIFQDWGNWAQHQLIDSIMPMAYGSTLASIRREIAEVQERIPAEVLLYPGLAIAKREADGYGGPDRPLINEQIALIRSMNLPGHVIFCYDWIIDSDEGFETFQEGAYRQEAPAPSPEE